MIKQNFIISSRDNLVSAYRFCESLGYGKVYVVEVKPLTRTIQQNKFLHSLFGDLERQAEWQGSKLTAEQWKMLMISGHTIATKEPCKMVIGVEGEVVNLRESSAQMSVARLNSLLEYVQCWAVENGVVISEQV